jgi:hypothetical protein
VRSWILALLALLSVAATPWRSASAAAEESIAILGIEPRDAGDARSQQRTAGLARTLTDALRQQASEPGSGYVLAPGAHKDLLELKLLSDCIDEAPGCMAAIGRDLGAEVVLFGNLERRADGSYAVWLRSLVTATRKAGPHSLVKTLASGEATDEGMRRLAAQLFPDATVTRDTTLIVEASVDHGTIAVNGIERGTVSSRKPTIIRGLPPGPARIRIEAGGQLWGETTVDLREGEPVRAAVGGGGGRRGSAALVEEPQGPARPGQASRVLFWTSLVATGAGVAAFTITGLQVRSIEKEQDAALVGFDYRANGVQHPGDACAEARHDGHAALIDICDRGKRMATLTNVLIGVSAATAVASAIFYWRGYVTPGGGRERTSARRREQRMVFGPELYPTGAGVGAAIQF